MALRLEPLHRRIAVAIAVAGVLVGGSLAAASDEVSSQAVPEAACGPGSRPETTDLQGRVPTADYDSGRVLEGYTCNTEQVGRHGTTGGFKTLRYTDAQGHTCAFYDSTRILGMDVVGNLLNGTGLGVVVLDMTNPASPRKTANLITPAMLSPHESLLVNAERGLLVGVMGTLATAPGVLDVYDVRTDCRRPKLLSTTLSGVLGHESGFAPDGQTFWTAGAAGFTMTAVDIADPRRPRVVLVKPGVIAHGLRFSDDGATMYVANMGTPSSSSILDKPSLQIYDVSQVQDRVTKPQVRLLSEIDWPGISIPQVAEPFHRDGRSYVLEVDEFTDWFGDRWTVDFKNSPVGGARIIDVTDPEAPSLVSDIRLEVHQAVNRTAEVMKDPGNALPIGGYSAHYCSVPTRDAPNLAACSMIGSGLRIFDISDVQDPREVAYFNKPAKGGASALSQPAWDPAGNSVWYTDGTSGFHVVRLTNGVETLLD
ncbi:LVIVD repeat-containing protein [Nocardioides sp. GCM10030258]|uniref:LVIVD repeat-containing protein n=1 Tax=unclassified Nocardioides TaxID=2615069 RepID=UPI0036216B6C